MEFLRDWFINHIKGQDMHYLTEHDPSRGAVSVAPTSAAAR